ncbi:hypothetical protein ACI2LF_24065 [Kribbella sp. NPDC020789]
MIRSLLVAQCDDTCADASLAHRQTGNEMTGITAPPRKRTTRHKPEPEPAFMRVEVRFGSHLISEWEGPTELGERLAEQQERDYNTKCKAIRKPIRPDELKKP